MFFSYLNNSFHRHLLEKKIKAKSRLVSGDILDIGSGSRRYDHFFSGQVTAIDQQPDPNKHILAGDMHQLDFPDQRFDAVVSFEVVCYTTNLSRVLEEILRVTKKGGVILLSVPFLVRDSRDNLRLTQKYWMEVLASCNVDYEVEVFGNSYTIIWDILRSRITQQKRMPAYWLLALLFSPYLFFVLLFHLAQMKDSAYYSGVFITIKTRA